MHTRTEDLLKIRDGEPVDAALRERILSDPDCVHELERLRHVAQALGELPQLEPPPDVWTRIAEETRPEPASDGPLWRWGAGAAIAASVAAAALLMLARAPDVPELAGPPPATVVGEGTGGSLPARPQVPAAYASLVAESARLERMLAEMPRQRQLMSADTASTIVGLEDRITWLDEQLSMAAARDLDPPRRRALWSERVDVMNALLHVRYAQSQ